MPPFREDDVNKLGPTWPKKKPAIVMLYFTKAGGSRSLDKKMVGEM